MKIYRLLSLGLLFVFITFGALGGCGSNGDGDDEDEIVIELICDDGIDNDDNGFTDCEDLACVTDPACAEGDDDDDDVVEPENICDDGIDNDGNGFTDCEDLACVIDPACEAVSCDDVINSLCERIDECGGAPFDFCISLLSDNEFFNCDEIADLPAANECIMDLDDFDCEELFNNFGPDSCAPSEGVCDVCEVDEDCGNGLTCVECFEDCTGVEMRCTGTIFDQVCEDGTFGFLPPL